MKCLSLETKTGIPCRRTVAAKGCPYHGTQHIQERLRAAQQPYVAPETQRELFPRLTRDQIKDLIRQGYEEQARQSAIRPDGCGCQG
jgi:hypothetical protein